MRIRIQYGDGSVDDEHVTQYTYHESGRVTLEGPHGTTARDGVHDVTLMKDYWADCTPRHGDSPYKGVRCSECDMSMHWLNMETFGPGYTRCPEGCYPY